MRFEPVKTKQRSAKHLSFYGTAAIVLLSFLCSITMVANSNHDRQKEYLESALRKDIMYCYATTGVYPDNLDTIENKYGLTYDKNQFYIDYKIIGKNIYPKVTVLEK